MRNPGRCQKMRIFSQHTLVMLVLITGFTTQAYAAGIDVSYDPQKDKIQIQASNASLTQLLGQIAGQAKIDIQIDPAVEKKISLQLRPQSLQNALQKICKDLSYVIEYRTNEQQQTVVSGLRLLPKGKQDSGQLVSVEAVNTPASQQLGRGDQANDNPQHINQPSSRSIHHRTGPGRIKKHLFRKSMNNISPDEQAAHGSGSGTTQEEKSPDVITREGTGNSENADTKTIPQGKQPCNSPYCAK